MTTRRSLASAWGITLLLSLQACFVTPLPEEETATVSFAIKLPGQQTARQALSASSPWDNLGLFHLDVFPKLMRAAVEYKDYELVHGTWPDSLGGLGAGEGPTGEVTLSLDVPAGMGRRLRALGFFKSKDESGEDKVSVYAEREPLELELSSGSSQQLDVDLVPVVTGRAALTVRCEETSGATRVPSAVSLVDARAQVVFPAHLLEQEPMASALRVELAEVPVGRPYWVRVLLVQASGGQALIDVRRPTFAVQKADEVQAVDVIVPCKGT